jgi:hypothetical protein
VALAVRESEKYKVCVSLPSVSLATSAISSPHLGGQLGDEGTYVHNGKVASYVHA